ncbi:hypothetical protein [Polyangium jinanense]|uniref:Cardiolipin synthase N-terminal domain-containing protein n=1 Tax=Polyangium jinanense TaxID=2829994 RepID=A0A9X4AZJ5_9BACT|nr:hypothetical protein [Polyangium jinanense]MDC3962102.1 hypothetical protein [Polyangium jinanense]MDC3988385.1 hypothetical protein [Polyangium jinanense]
MGIALVTLAVVVMLVQLGITVRLWRSDLYTRGQKIAQSAMIWLLPVVGAIVVYVGLRHTEDVPRLKPNSEGGEHQSLWWTNHDP